MPKEAKAKELPRFTADELNRLHQAMNSLPCEISRDYQQEDMDAEILRTIKQLYTVAVREEKAAMREYEKDIAEAIRIVRAKREAKP